MQIKNLQRLPLLLTFTTLLGCGSGQQPATTSEVLTCTSADGVPCEARILSAAIAGDRLELIEELSAAGAESASTWLAAKGASETPLVFVRGESDAPSEPDWELEPAPAQYDFRVPAAIGSMDSASIASSVAAVSGGLAIELDDRWVAAAPLIDRLTFDLLDISSADSNTALLLGAADAALRAGDEVRAGFIIHDLFERRLAAGAPDAELLPLAYAVHVVSGARGPDLEDWATYVADAYDRDSSPQSLASLVYHLLSYEDLIGVGAASTIGGSIKDDNEAIDRLAESAHTVVNAQEGPAVEALAYMIAIAAPMTDTRPAACREDSRWPLDVDAQEGLAALGREDLTVRARAWDVLSARNVVRAERLRSLERWLESDERFWLRSRATGQLANALSSGELTLDALATAQLVGTRYIETLRAESETDFSEEWISRDMNRLVALSSGLQIGGAGADVFLAEVIDKAMSAEDPDEALGGLALGIAGGLASAVLTGQNTRLQLLAVAVDEIDSRLRERLEGTDRQRVIRAGVRVLRTGVGVLMGEATQIETVLYEESLALQELVTSGADLEGYDQWAAVVSAGLDITRFAYVAITRDPEEAEAILVGLADSLPALASYGLALLEAPIPREDIEELIALTLDVVETLSDDGDVTQLLDRLVALELADLDGTKWWGVGLEMTRIALADAIAARATTPELRSAALEQAESYLGDGLHRAISDFEIDPQIGDWFDVVPPLHGLLLGAILAEDDFDVAIQRLWEERDPSIDRIVEAIELLVTNRNDPGDTVRLVADIAAYFAAHPEVIFESSDDWTVDFTTYLAERSGEYRAEIAALIRASSAGLLTDAPNEARAELDAARELMASTELSDDVWILDWIAALSFEREPGMEDDALARFESFENLEYEYAGCGLQHPSQELGLMQAWLEARGGDFTGARATLATHIAAIDAGELTGDAQLSFRLRSEQVGAFAEVMIGTSLVGALTDDNAGAFNVNAAYQSSLERSREIMRFDITHAPVRREDRYMQAWLYEAAFAFADGDDVAAHYAIQKAVEAGSRVLYATPTVLGQNLGNALAAQRSSVDVSLGLVVAAVARSRGHIYSAAQLERLVRELDAFADNPVVEVEWDDDDSAGDSVLGSVPGYENAADWSTASVASYRSRDAERVAELTIEGPLTEATPQMLMIDMIDDPSVVRGNRDAILALDDLSSLPVDGPLAATQSALVWIDGGAPIPLEVAIDTVTQIAANGFDAEALFLSWTLATVFAEANRLPDGVEVVRAALGAADPNRAPIAYATLLERYFPVAQATGDPVIQTGVLVDMRGLASGRMDASVEVQHLTDLVMLALSLQDFALLETVVTELAVVYSRLGGESLATAHGLALVRDACRVINGEEIDFGLLGEHAHAYGDPMTLEFARLLEEAAESDRPAIAAEFIVGFLG